MKIGDKLECIENYIHKDGIITFFSGKNYEIIDIHDNNDTFDFITGGVEVKVDNSTDAIDKIMYPDGEYIYRVETQWFLWDKSNNDGYIWKYFKKV